MKLKAGTYWVGDLCYYIGDPDWGELCSFLFKQNERGEGAFTLKGAKGAIFGTAYGDGCYSDNLGNEYGVDSGTIGIFPVGFVSNGNFPQGGTVHNFPEDFEVSSKRGNMKFGHIAIDTREE